jgi:Lrp/AsnC family transcriptional regulator
MLDDIDRRLLRILQRDPVAPLGELAEHARVSQATATRRLERLRAQGVIRAQRVTINWAALGYTVEVSLRITLDKTNPRAFDEFQLAARRVREVIEVQTFLGQVDIRLGVIARDMAHYQSIYRADILTLPHIADIEALMHIAEIKNEQVLPI